MEVALDAVNWRSWFHAHQFAKKFIFRAIFSAFFNYIPKICVLLGAITMTSFRFVKNAAFSENQFVWKKHLFCHYIWSNNFSKKCCYIGHLMIILCNFFQNFPQFHFLNNWKRTKTYFFYLSHNFLNNAWKNLKFWVSSLFMLVNQCLCLKFISFTFINKNLCQQCSVVGLLK